MNYSPYSALPFSGNDAKHVRAPSSKSTSPLKTLTMQVFSHTISILFFVNLRIWLVNHLQIRLYGQVLIQQLFCYPQGEAKDDEQCSKKASAKVQRADREIVIGRGIQEVGKPHHQKEEHAENQAF